ncbi:MAG: hypothetical protein M1297_01960 [Nitrospirae bacterium]|jgi:archaellum component FlaC|nr:hypothetical protein [Nitrospirota bacterium]
MAGSIEAVQKILQETVAPGISRLEIELAGVKADIKSLQSEIKRLDDKIDNGLSRLDDKIDNGLSRFDARMDHLEDKLTTALEIRERLAALEAKVAAH